MGTRICRIVTLLILGITVLAGIGSAAAQDAPPTATPDAAIDATTLFNGPIADPRVDPTGTLDDAFFYSLDHDSVVPAKSGDTTLQPGAFQHLPADVAVTDFYAEFSFLTPQIPEGGEFSAGFCFWTDLDGNCYDFYLQTDRAGNTFAGMGYAPIEGDYVTIMQTALLAGQPIDPTPGAENSVDIVVYDGYAIIEGTTYEPLAVLALPDAALAGKVKAQIGFVDAGLAAGTAPLAVSISDFAVWDLSGADGSAEALPGTPTSATGEPVAQPTIVPESTAPAQQTPSAVNAAITPDLPVLQGDAILTMVFERTRARAIELPPLVGGLSGDLPQTATTFAWTGGGVNVADFYAIATFVNPTGEYAPSDIGIGFRIANATDPGMRFVVQSTGMWSLLSPTDETIASGMAASFDPTPGASNTIEIVAHGATGLIAVNGVVLPQVVLSAVMTPGDLLVGTGFMQGDGIDGRTVPYREFWVYPLI